MFGAEYRWLLPHPLLRGWLLTLVFASLCVGVLFLEPAAPAARETAARDPVSRVASVDQQAAWPRTVLRLWFLVPQLLPLAER
ncbi:MAG: hypothetical protein ACOZE5_07745 [Verrucomicrobiota bacterium]